MWLVPLGKDPWKPAPGLPQTARTLCWDTATSPKESQNLGRSWRPPTPSPGAWHPGPAADQLRFLTATLLLRLGPRPPPHGHPQSAAGRSAPCPQCPADGPRSCPMAPQVRHLHATPARNPRNETTRTAAAVAMAGTRPPPARPSAAGGKRSAAARRVATQQDKTWRPKTCRTGDGSSNEGTESQKTTCRVGPAI